MIRYRICSLTAWNDELMSDTEIGEGLFTRLRKTRKSLAGALLGVFSGSEGDIDASLLDDIEDQLILSDLGVEVSREVVDILRNRTENRRNW